MQTRVLLLSLALSACNSSPPQSDAPPKAASREDSKAKPVLANVSNHEVKLLDGSMKSLDAYKGKALLVVNTASECGLTPQYEDLQALYAKYKDRGFEVLAFPSNDYGGQEPGTPDEIRAFVDEQYNITFTMFDKLVVKGPNKAPLYKTLTEQTAGDIQGEVKWNFTKFLVDPSGNVVARFESEVSPSDPALNAAIEKILPKGS